MDLTPQRSFALAAFLLTAWFLLGTFPYLADYPLLDWPQMGIAAPAYKLASEGVYGNDLFTGFHRTELRNYEYMPAYPLLVAASFKLFGLGVLQARLVSVLCALLTVWLTYKVGSLLFDRVIGIAAAAFLTVVRLSPTAGGSGITLIDFARVIRYDILVPVFVMSACWAFLLGLRSSKASHSARRAQWMLFAAGSTAGLATLAHIYGAFIVPVFLAVLVWRYGVGVLRQPSPYVVVFGWLVAQLPWVVYVLQDLPAFVGQMSRHEGRFDLFSLTFYWSNLIREHARYGPWTGGFPAGLFLPRLGFWLMCVGVLGSWGMLWRQLRHRQDLSARFTVVALPMLAFQLALLLTLKRHVYVLLVLPFIAMQVGYCGVIAWRWTCQSGSTKLRAGLVLVLVAALVESTIGVSTSLKAARHTTEYDEIASAIAAAIPVESTVLLSQPFWMRLAHQETRSINLAFVQAPQIPMRETLRFLSADYVVIERSAIDLSIPDPRRSRDPQVVQLWEIFAKYLEEECPRRVLTIPDPSYGIIDVYACTTEGPVRNGARRAR